MDCRSKISFRKLKIEDRLPLTLVWLGVCLFLLICILSPLVYVLLTPTKADFIKVATTAVWRKTALNTLIEVICSTSAAVAIGYIYAFAVVKGAVPFRRFFSFVPFLHLVTPPFVGGLAFILLLGRQGFITKTMLGLDVSLYGFWGLLIAQALCFFPMAYMICVQTLENINPNPKFVG